METEDFLKDFESSLEVLIKRCLAKELYDDNDEFLIAADFDTHCRLNSLVESIGIEVYGMRITPSEFTITFQFTGDYEECIYKLNGPKYCHINLKNDGEYEFNLTKSDLSLNFWLSITDIQFNIKNVNEQKFNEVLKNMKETLVVYALKC
jgi:hypothetical protein